MLNYGEGSTKGVGSTEAVGGRRGWGHSSALGQKGGQGREMSDGWAPGGERARLQLCQPGRSAEKPDPWTRVVQPPDPLEWRRNTV